MSKIKNIIEQIRSKLTDQQRTELNNYLSVIESEYTKALTEAETAKADYDEKDNQYKEVLRESIQRKKKLQSIESELEALKNDKSVENLKQELESLKKYKADRVKEDRVNIINILTEKAKNPKIAEASKILILPETAKNDKGEIDLLKVKVADWDKITDEQMEHNKSELQKLDLLNFWETKEQKTRQIIPGQRPSIVKPENQEPIKTKADLKQKVGELLSEVQKT